MAEKKIICITCPQGCIITVEGDAASGRIDSVKGFSCPRGKKYAESEFVHPVRILTSSVRSDIRPDCPLPVRTAGPITKELLFEGMEEIRKITVHGKIGIGDVIVKNFLGTGTDLIASGSIE